MRRTRAIGMAGMVLFSTAAGEKTPVTAVEGCALRWAHRVFTSADAFAAWFDRRGGSYARWASANRGAAARLDALTGRELVAVSQAVGFFVVNVAP